MKRVIGGGPKMLSVDCSAIKCAEHLCFDTTQLAETNAKQKKNYLKMFLFAFASATINLLLEFHRLLIHFSKPPARFKQRPSLSLSSKMFIIWAMRCFLLPVFAVRMIKHDNLLSPKTTLHVNTIGDFPRSIRRFVHFRFSTLLNSLVRFATIRPLNTKRFGFCFHCYCCCCCCCFHLSSRISQVAFSIASQIHE